MKKSENKIYVMKWSEMFKTLKDDEEEESHSESEEEEK